MLQAAFERGWLEPDRTILESLLSLRRAGAGFLITYFAQQAAQLLNT
jgi:porphobilinogen synthase